MPIYEIQTCSCGRTETVCRMGEFQKDEDGRTYRPCMCGQWCRQAYRTAPGGIVDGPADAKPFKVAGIEGTFTSHKQLEQHCRANNLDLSTTRDESWKKTKHRSRAGAESLAKEMGYSSLGQYKELSKDKAHMKERLNNTRERQNKPRD